MTVYGPATGNFSASSIRSSRSTASNRPTPERLIDSETLGGHRATYNPVVLSQRYSNDYQAEINRRAAIDPGDPAIAVLTDLRKQKLAGQKTTGDYGIDSGYGTDYNSSGSVGDATNTLIDNNADYQSKQFLASLRNAYDTQRNDLNAHKPLIQQEASDMRNSADTSYYQSLPELYKAMESGGQRGGENITGMVGLNTVRGQGRNNADLYETNQLRNIDNAITNLGSQQSQAEAEGLMGIGSDTFAAKLQAMRDAVTRADTLRQQEKADYTNTVGAYADNYMQEVNNLRSQGVPDTDYRIKVLLAARNQKILDQQAAAREAEQDSEANALAWARINKTGSSNSGGGDSELTYDEALVRYQQGDRSDAVLRRLNMK